MKSCKAVLWLFPIVTNTGLVKSRHRKVKRDHISHSPLEFTPYSSFFCPQWVFQLSISQRESEKNECSFRAYPKAPERKWAFPSVGNTVCLFTLHTSCHRVSGWDYPTHGVTNLNTKHKEKTLDKNE